MKKIISLFLGSIIAIIFSTVVANSAANQVRVAFFLEWATPNQEAKVKKVFVCSSCGTTHSKWQGKCDGCHEWNTIQEEVVEKVESKNEPVEISEEKVMGTKFTMSVQTIGALAMVIASGVGGYYMLLQEIEEAKELPKIDIEAIYKDEYPSRPEGHNWPRSKEQYNQQVGDLQDDMDTVFDRLDELEDDVKDLKKLVTELRVQVANKRDK